MRSSELAQLRACPAFQTASTAACYLVANVESGRSLFGALPMFHQSHYDHALQLSMAELSRAETRLDVLKRDGVSAEQVRRALDDEEADLLDQAGRVSSDLSSSRATLRALGGSIRALSETLQDTRLNAHLQPLFSNGE